VPGDSIYNARTEMLHTNLAPSRRSLPAEVVDQSNDLLDKVDRLL